MKQLFGLFYLLLLLVLASPSFAQLASEEPRVVKGASFSLTFRNIPSEDASIVNGEYTVSQKDGTVALPHLKGRVHVVGKTARQVEDLVATLYREQGIYTNPIVSVALDPSFTKALTERHVLVSGKVAVQKNLIYRPGLTLLQAIIECGNITDQGSRYIQVTRKNMTQTYDYFSARDRNIRLVPDDVIFVPDRGAFEARPSRIGP